MSSGDRKEIIPHGRVWYPGSYTSEEAPAPTPPAPQPPAEIPAPAPAPAPVERPPEPAPAPQLNIQHFDLPPVTRTRDVLISRPHLQEKVIEIPHVQYIERIEEIPHIRKVAKTIHMPKVDVTERVIEIPKHIKEQKIVEVPQVQVVDHVVEVPQYITQQKIVEVPRMMLQERIIPIPKRTIEEKVVEIPREEFEQVLKERVEYATPAYGPAHMLDLRQIDDADFAGEDEPIFDIEGKPVTDEFGRQIYRQRLGEPLEEGQEYPYPGHAPYRQPRSAAISATGRPVDEVVEIPHVQHVYRNIMQSVYRHVPKPVEVPLTHYKPIPVEHVVDRNVPIPVELEVVQEFLCPRLEAKYVEVAIPIPVTRVIEKPVPADAMFNSVIMDAYMRGQPPTVTSCYQSCAPGPEPIPKQKMNAVELKAAGISAQPSFSQVKSFKSRGPSYGGINVDRGERDWLAQQRTLIKEGTKEHYHL